MTWYTGYEMLTVAQSAKRRSARGDRALLRNEIIAKLRAARMSYAAIGSLYGVSGARVRQVILKAARRQEAAA